MAGSVREIFHQKLNSKISPDCVKLRNIGTRHIILRWQKVALAQQFQPSQRRIQRIIRKFKKPEQFPKFSSQGRKPYAKYQENSHKLACALHLRRKIGANYIDEIRDKIISEALMAQSRVS